MSGERADMKFEEALARLETVVRELEEGKQPLEKALELFSEGVALSRICSKHLEEAEQKIYLLTQNEKGEPVVTEDKQFWSGEGGGA